jgi:hypothetical protein
MTAFRGIFLAGLISILLWILIAWGLWMIIEPCVPMFSLPEMTPAERKMVEQARKYHGDYPITREGYEGKYFMHIKGKKVAL